MNTEDFEFGDTYDRPLIPDDFGGPPEDLVFDETGAFGLTRIASSLSTELAVRPPVPELTWTRPCGLGVLDGSWNIEIMPTSGALFGSLRGPMRIEANGGVLRVSGDAYHAIPTVAERADRSSLPITKASFIKHWHLNWYPHYAFKEYVWYFRSTGASYIDGQLYFPFTRHLWNRTTQEFTSTDSGWMRFPCATRISQTGWRLQPTVRMDGQAMIGSTLHTVTATKTSSYYRGLIVEVDVMTNRGWPGSPGGQSFTGTYRGDGIDVRMYINETNVPEDNTLTDAECYALMATHRAVSSIGSTWRLWTLVGSRRSGDNTFGLMFDTSAPEREGCVSYTDATFDNSSLLEPGVRNQRLGDVPLAHLRTLIHELGHCLNLYHPKADDHNPPIGETIMNQTGDVMSFATSGSLYPSNAEFRFDDHSRTSLIHSPDPQVAPGWKPFGWGHASPNLGVPEPTDVVGLRDVGLLEDALQISLDVPDTLTTGEFVTARVILTNKGDQKLAVSRSLNLAEGDLEMIVRVPQGDEVIIRDVVHLCGQAKTADLEPGDSLEAVLQLFYTSTGYMFEKAGTYELRAVYSPRPGSPERIVSKPRQMTVHGAESEDEQRVAELSMDPGVGLSFALGDFGADTEVADKLRTLAADFAETDTGTAAALVLANSYSRPFRDLSEGVVSRKSSTKEAEAAVDHALIGTNLDRVAELATAVASAGDTEAPVIGLIRQRIDSGEKTKGGKVASQRALDILADYVRDD